ncbi:MAG: phosphotransferase family protein [Acidimicrobiaceae bacterium]|nr:phosphotransferase family protein [Acidimicrobiaceae bacterium]
MTESANDEYSDMAAPLAAWLTERLDDVNHVEVGAFDRPSGGYSAETLIVPITVTTPASTEDRTIVLRREMPEPPVYPVQVPVDNEIEIQWRVMSALATHADVPIAPLLGYETDPDVLGSPFFVMDFIGGDIPREDPAYVLSGFYAEADSAARELMATRCIDVMAGVHAVDIETADLGWLSDSDVNDGHRQLEIWRDYAERELDGRPHDLMMAAFDRVADELPKTDTTVLAWGDARLGNVIWQDFRPACLTDFEAAALAPPEMDLGWCLMFEQWSHALAGIDLLPGIPSTELQVEHYVAVSNHEVADIGPWVLFAAARYAAIVVRIMNRWVDRGLLDADQTVYLDPIAPVLRPLLDA